MCRGTPRKATSAHGAWSTDDAFSLMKAAEIGGIAKSAGYRNQGAFTDAFKRAYGTTPRAYRKRLRIE